MPKRYSDSHDRWTNLSCKWQVKQRLLESWALPAQWVGYSKCLFIHFPLLGGISSTIISACWVFHVCSYCFIKSPNISFHNCSQRIWKIQLLVSFPLKSLLKFLASARFIWQYVICLNYIHLNHALVMHFLYRWKYVI